MSICQFHYAALRLPIVALMLVAAACGTAAKPVLDDNCGPTHGPPEFYFEQVLHWTPDGAHLLFDYDGTIQVVDTQGIQTREVVDLDPRYSGATSIAASQLSLNLGLYFDVSPQGTRVVYTSCEYREVSQYTSPEYLTYNYEIAVVNIDGTGQKRLTMDSHLDHYPVWSPDGSKIAFLSRYSTQYWEVITIAPDGSDRQVIVSDAVLNKAVRGTDEHDSQWSVGVSVSPPVWSPDGGRLAFLVGEWKEEKYMTYLFTVRDDGTELTRVAPTVSRVQHTEVPGKWSPLMPAWSPDSEYLAFAMADEERKSAGVYTTRPDGTELRQALAPQSPAWSVSYLAWTSDGSEIVILSRGEGIYIIEAEGDGLQRHIQQSLPLVATGGAAWSPDGNRIALYVSADSDSGRPAQVYTIARDGSDRRDLITLDADGNLVPANPPQEKAE